MKTIEPLLAELSGAGRRAVRMPPIDVPLAPLPSGHIRHELYLPELSEADVVRHFAHLAKLNISNVTSLQSSGSCTVKYNPVVNEELAGLSGFANIHPYQPTEQIQGALRVVYELGQWLSDLIGLSAVSLQPAAGAQAQLAGLLMCRLHMREREEEARRDTILVTSTCHGSNPASAVMAGFKVVTVPHNARGNVDLQALRGSLSERTAAFMLTNPNTHGVFEEEALKISELVHQAGALLFLDGANLNAIVGKIRPADLGVDLCVLNLHKTFSTPHGGNGPGAGALLARADMEKYLPAPVVARRENGQYFLDGDRPQSIGRVRSFYGQFGILLRAFAYILAQGPSGLRQQAEDAVLNANYLLEQIRDQYPAYYDRIYLHEFLVSMDVLKRHGVDARSAALRLMDHGYHPPNVPARLKNEALLIEPTETESKESLENFAAALLAVAAESAMNPEIVRTAPHTTPVKRLTATRPNGRPDVATCQPPAAGVGTAGQNA